ncbi:AAA family ATPase [uncultured Lacinutrix sp.]|uniref:AAA family ATPase n=1 Tax=uncultured Lacinutrix sp. TaxID=574032 RepID=UPI002618F7DF|nr:AAA family ATPase [uncultured Lacinutrix sp.]
MNGKCDIELFESNDSCFKDYYLDVNNEESIRFLPNINNINLFIGANNSGKSRFLRELMNPSSLLGFRDSQLLFQYINKFNSLLEDFNYSFQIHNTGILYLIKELGSDLIEKELNFEQSGKFGFTEINTQKSVNSLFSDIKQVLLFSKKLECIFNIANNLYGINRGRFIGQVTFNGSTINESQFFRKEKIFDEINIVVLKMQNASEIIELKGNKIYIPTLRTAHSLFELDKRDKVSSITDVISRRKIKEDIFKETIRKNYLKLSDDIEIFTGLNLYNEIVNIRNSRKEDRLMFHEFENFLSENFFNGKDIDIVAKFNIDNNNLGIDEDNLIQVFIDDKSEKLHDLGDGVQSLIILMYKIFLAKKDSLIFIDEPELNLHPGYQRLFLEQITTNQTLLDKNLTYFMVTHSNHFLDLTLEKDDVSIYSFNSFKTDKFLIKNVNAGDNQVLRDLGVNNSSVFLANSSIWVEGVSDRNLVKAFLKAYCQAEGKKEPREDIDYAFFEYAGSNLTHYDFKKRTNDYHEAKDLITSYALNNRILLLSDLDSGKEKKHFNIKEISEETEGFKYYTTAPYRELENLLSSSIWKKILINFCKKKDVENNQENIQKRIDESLLKNKTADYKTDYIGSFLKDLKITELNKIYKVDDNGIPGTLVPKTELSQLILNKVRNKEITWDDFSSNATIVFLTEKIYDFIMDS